MSTPLEFVKDIFSKIKYDVEAFDNEQMFPSMAWAAVGNSGFLGLMAPETYGGSGMDAAETMPYLEALGYVSEDSGFGFGVAAHMFGSVVPMSLFASEMLKEKYLSDMISTSKPWCHAVTETEAGSDVFSMTTTAVKGEGVFNLKGNKTFCSNLSEADYALVYAVTDGSAESLSRFTAFVVPKNKFSIGQKFTKMGLRTCSLGEMMIDAQIGEQEAVGKVGSGLLIFSTAMDWERIGMSALHVGTMRRIFEEVLQYVKTRKQGGKSIGNHQAVAHKIAEMKTSIETCKALVEKASALLGKDRSATEYAAMCKYHVSESYVALCRNSMHLYGGNGYIKGVGPERHLRDAMASTIYSGTTEIQKNIIAGWNGLNSH